MKKETKMLLLKELEVTQEQLCEIHSACTELLIAYNSLCCAFHPTNIRKVKDLMVTDMYCEIYELERVCKDLMNDLNESK